MNTDPVATWTDLIRVSNDRRDDRQKDENNKSVIGHENEIQRLTQSVHAGVTLFTIILERESESISSSHVPYEGDRHYTL